MATTPSIAMIPSGYKANKVYSVLPTDGSGDLDFARTTKATRVNQNGLIEEVAIGVPRLDYTDGGCPSLLLEGNSTNLITESELFDNAYWTKSGATVTSGFSAPSVDSPLGAFKLVEDTSNGVHRVQRDFTVASSLDSYSVSARVKKGERNYVILALRTVSFANRAEATFDLLNGTISVPAFGSGDLTNISAKITALADGWYDVSLSCTKNSDITINSYLHIAKTSTDGVATTYAGDGTSGVYIFASQLEQNSSATSYIKTSGTTISRTADSASKSGISSLINSSQGVLYVEMSALSDDGTARSISLSNGSTSNKVSLIYTSTSNQLQAFIRSSGSIAFNVSEILSDTTNNNKIALKYKENDFALWVNGIEVATGTSGNAPTGLNVLDFDDADGLSNFYGNVKDLRVYKTILSDSELQILTTI